MTYECTREQDVLNALAADRWPARCDEALRTHVSSCAICRDLADVAACLADDRDAGWREAHVPSAGVVWWHAQLRAREDAARAAGRPVAFIQGVAASVAVWLAIALLRAIPVAEWQTWAAALFSAVPITMSEVSRVTAILPLAVLLIVGGWLLLAPIAIYFAVADE